MEKKRFMVDTNVFIAAFKSGYTVTTKLLLKLLLDPKVELIADDVLLYEYRKWFDRLASAVPTVKEQAKILYRLIEEKATIIKPEKEDIGAVKPYMPETEYADTYHAAACLKAKATLITNDRDYDNVKSNHLIEVWSITEALRNFRII